MDTSNKEIGEMRSRIQAAREPIQAQILPFIVSLALEGERSAVVLGAERINVALEQLLKSFLLPSLKEKDSLFTSEGALSTFARKAEVAYRLGLLDLHFKQAIDVIRKLRNDFAHATKVETLQLQSHSDKVKSLFQQIQKGNEHHIKTFRPFFKKAGVSSKQRQDYLICVVMLLIKIELVRIHLKPPEIMLPAKLEYSP